MVHPAGANGSLQEYRGGQEEREEAERDDDLRQKREIEKQVKKAGKTDDPVEEAHEE